jgi:hypothetical protein
LKAKKLIALIAAAAVAMSLAGCSLSREVASLDPYAPSDGVQIDKGELKVRNVMFVVGDDGNAVLIGSFVNQSEEAVSGTLETMDSNGAVVVTDFSVPAESKFDLGYNGTDGKRLYLTEIPGSMHPVFVRIAGNDPVELPTPILDGTLEEYRPFVD